MQKTYLATAATLALAGFASAATLTPLSTFGSNGDGWWAPGEAGVTYLTTDNNQRSLAYNAATGNLLLVNGLSVRVLNGSTGVASGLLTTTGITGGDRALNEIGATTDGVIYGTNLRANTTTGNFKIYRWATEGAAPANVYDGNTGLNPVRVGDSFDVLRASDASGALIAGYSNTGNTTAGNNGYVVFNSGTGPLTPNRPVLPTPPNAGDFRLALTFAQDVSNVWGKQTGSGNLLRRTSYSGAVGTLEGSNTMTASSETAMDYIMIDGKSYLAMLDITSSMVRVYDATDPANLALLVSGTSTSGTLLANGNGTGGVAWGTLNGGDITLYAMSTNQGIQAFTFNIPEPTSLSLLALGGVAMLRRRK